MQFYSYSIAFQSHPEKYERVCLNAPKKSYFVIDCGYWPQV
ncbi:hypothetical protein HMPREF3212_02813 [Citrobacter freundii]|nr:hypothetical protein HMPREF3212_02813 [Citrobacter freundii]